MISPVGRHNSQTVASIIPIIPRKMSDDDTNVSQPSCEENRSQVSLNSTDDEDGEACYGYWLKTDGSIKRESMNGVDDLNDLKLFEHGMYMFNVGGELWFLMHNDNDTPALSHNGVTAKTRLRHNKAMANIFPQSQYVGDIFVVKTTDDESDDLLRGEWSLRDALRDVERNYRISLRKDDQDLMVVPTSDRS